nr:hypothetical protein [Tanacetum cinerariifolium]
MDEGTKILANVDGKSRTISESSIRRNLKLKDEAGISSLPDAAFQKPYTDGFSGRTVPLFPTMLVTMGKGSGTLTEPHYIPTHEVQQSPPTATSSLSFLPVTTESFPIVIPTETPYSGNIPGELGLLSPHLFPLLQMSLHLLLGMTVKTEMASKLTTQDLEIASLKARIKMLEDKDGGVTEPSGEDDTIKGRSLETGEEVGVKKSTERGSNDTKEMENVLTSLDAASILTSGGGVVSVPPAGEIPTISVPTASLIFTTATVTTPYSRRKGKEKMVVSDTPKKKKLQEHINVQVAREMEEQLAKEDQRRDKKIARDAEIARIHAEEELQMVIDGLDRSNEMIAKHLHEYEQAVDELTIGENIKLINELGMTLDEIREKFIPVCKQIEDFVPMGTKEEEERFKKKGLRLEHESTKKVKTSEEVSEEDLKTMMHLVSLGEVYVEALQVKHLIID